MFNFFDLNIIPTFLSSFGVEKILVIGLSNELIMDEVISFCIDNTAFLYGIDSEINVKSLIKEDFDLDDIDGYLNEHVKHFKDHALNILPHLETFDAIFVNDDPNWYTLYNELNLIKMNHLNFPLVFVCNNKYPHKRRDGYIDPKFIPDEYRNEYCEELPITYMESSEIKCVMVNDGFCHAIHENTPKNGVLTAIEDFLSENNSLRFLDINPLEGISLIYPHSNISYILINQICEGELSSEYTIGDLSDKFIENSLLLNHIAGDGLINNNLVFDDRFQSKLEEKNNQLRDYENEIELYNSQLKIKDLEIANVERQVSLKDTKLQKMEAELLNKDEDIRLKENEIESVQNKVNYLESVISDNKKELDTTKKQLSESESQSRNHEIVVNKYKELLEISNMKMGLDARIRQDAWESEYFRQCRDLDTKEYCIHCYEEKIRYNDLEIGYLRRNDNFVKKLIAPFAYVFLVSKSKLKEIGVNIKLYRGLKDSDCFDVGYYLGKYPDILESKWCRYFSPELHYVCEGFDENRRFNKKYYSIKSKRELIEDIKK